MKIVTVILLMSLGLAFADRHDDCDKYLYTDPQKYRECWGLPTKPLNPEKDKRDQDCYKKYPNPADRRKLFECMGENYDKHLADCRKLKARVIDGAIKGGMDPKDAQLVGDGMFPECSTRKVPPPNFVAPPH